MDLTNKVNFFCVGNCRGFWGYFVLVSPKVRGLVVVLGLRGEILGIWLVVYGFSTGGDENILSLLMLDQDWPRGVWWGGF